MKYKYVFFDLDGTLLDTLDDLRDSVNTILRRHGMPEIGMNEAAHYLGNGAAHLVHCSIPEGTSPDVEKKVLKEYRSYYQEHCLVKTAPYPGIPELLSQLKEAGCRMAVVSNKPDAAVKELNDHFFGGVLEQAIGEREGVRRKPEPDTVIEAMRILGAEKSGSVYIGDTEVDIETARNCDLSCITVSWGFRSEEELKKAGAQTIVSTADALGRILL